jgi:predicted dehydrogenase
VVQQSGRGEIVSVYDPDITSSDIVYSLADSSEDIINNDEIDAVFICTPNYLNKPLTIDALQKGKHVFCEKPPAFNASEVEEIRAMERSTGKRLMYGFNHRNHTSIQHMKKIIEDGEFGEILWMRGRYGKSVDKSFYDNWRSNKELAGGGILLDQGIHMLDLFLYFGGEFDRIEAFVSNLYWNVEIEDNVFAILKNSRTGVVASLHSTMTQWRHLFSLEIFLSKGYLVLNGLKTSSQSYGEELLSIAKNRSTAPAATWEDEERITYHEDISWRSEIDHFFEAIENGIPISIGNSEDALILMKTIDMIYEKGTQK